MTVFAHCEKCPTRVSCDIRSACDLAPKPRTADELLAEITGLRVRQKQLQEELSNANGALIASREEARQLNATIDRMQSYETTRQFHELQAIPEIGLLVADLEVTEEEDEAFAALALRIDRLENAFSLQQGRINTAHDRLDAMKGAL